MSRVSSFSASFLFSPAHTTNNFFSNAPKNRLAEIKRAEIKRKEKTSPRTKIRQQQERMARLKIVQHTCVKLSNPDFTWNASESSKLNGCQEFNLRKNDRGFKHTQQILNVWNLRKTLKFSIRHAHFSIRYLEETRLSHVLLRARFPPDMEEAKKKKKFDEQNIWLQQRALNNNLNNPRGVRELLLATPQRHDDGWNLYKNNWISVCVDVVLHKVDTLPCSRIIRLTGSTTHFIIIEHHHARCRCCGWSDLVSSRMSQIGETIA